MATEVGVDVQLCPLDLSLDEGTPTDGTSTQHQKFEQLIPVLPFIRQWWGGQLALGTAQLLDLPPHISDSVVPAGVVGTIAIDGVGMLFFQVVLSASSTHSSLAGGLVNGLPACLKLDNLHATATGTFGKPIVWSQRLVSSIPFQLPLECTLPPCPWLADACALIHDRFTTLLDFDGRSRASLSGLPRAGGVLVTGPSGSGKTTLLSLLPNHLSRKLTYPVIGIFVSCSNLVGSSHASVQCELRSAIQAAKAQAPSLLLLDDIDSLFPTSEDESSTAPLSAADPSAGLASWLAGMIMHDTPAQSWSGRRNLGAWPVGVVASSTVASTVSAVLRGPGRLDFEASLEQPGLDYQRSLVSSALADQNVEDPDGLLQKALPHVDGCDTFDLLVLVDRARLAATRRRLAGRLESLSASLTSEAPGQQILMNESDVSLACEGFVASALRRVAQPASASSAPIMGWQDVGGAHAAVAAITDALELASLTSGWAQAAPLRLRTGLLLYGPPGCGKTHLVRCAASATGMRLVSVKGPELLNKYIGQSEAGVRRIFSKAAAAAPCILFFDEFDSLAPKRGHDNTGVTDRVVNALLAELDGVQGLNGVVVLAATSRPDLLDAALLRPGRLDRSVECGMPNEEDRVSIAAALARHLPFGAGADVGPVAAAADGLSGADISAALADAHLIAVHEKLDISPAGCDEVQEVLITQAHLQSAFKAIRPSLSSHERRRLEKLYDQFRGFRSGHSAGQQQSVTLA
mmetsp:Transcript_18951/g.52855  ORF Transcript_18951/g.52855 Transcript_18951/m.52855 type:complete len:747 (-) Transcript_18951:202-2442(-)